MLGVVVFLITHIVCFGQVLPPKQAYPFTVKQIHSGHSLTDPLFYPHWPGQYVNLMSTVLQQPAWQLTDRTIGKSTIPGSSMSARWQKPPANNSPDARNGIANWEVLSITERVPLLYEGGSTQQWYIDALAEQREMLSLFTNNAWTNGNNGKGAATLLWTTWTHVDGSSGPFRQTLDVQGREWERMQDYANARRVAGSPPVYLIPGHKMMARLYDDIQKGVVPGITNITQFFSDQIHTNELGAYAISMMHYACIFNRSPLGLPNNLLPNAASGTPIPSPELARYIQTMVWDVVTSYDRTGITASTSVVDSASANAPLIFPNPASIGITINLGAAAASNVPVILYDLTGTAVRATHIDAGSSATIMDLQGLPCGHYTAHIGDGLGIAPLDHFIPLSFCP